MEDKPIKAVSHLIYAGKEDGKNHLKQICTIIELTNYKNKNYLYEGTWFDEHKTITQGLERFSYHIDLKIGDQKPTTDDVPDFNKIVLRTLALYNLNSVDSFMNEFAPIALDACVNRYSDNYKFLTEETRKLVEKYL